jgi:uncharacterized protein YjdB
MKIGNWAFAAIAAILVCGFVFTGCNDDSGTTAVKKVAVTGLTLNRATLGLLVGDVETIDYTLSPSKATNKKLNWSSNNSSVASVVNGVVTAHAEGTALITVMADDGGGYSRATCAVTVGIVEVTGVTLSR